MKFYADNGARRTRQLVADVVFVAWCVAAVWLGRFVHQQALVAQDGARELESGSASLANRVRDAGDAVANIPLVGSTVRDPFDKAADAARNLSGSGHDLATGLGRFAVFLGVLTALLPIVLAFLPWGFFRLRYASAAGRLAQLRAMPGGQRLLALEALTSAKPRELAAISDDPARSWQRDEPVATQRLASLVLATYGLRHPGESGGDGRPRDVDGAHVARQPWQG